MQQIVAELTSIKEKHSSRCKSKTLMECREGVGEIEQVGWARRRAVGKRDRDEREGRRTERSACRGEEKRYGKMLKCGVTPVLC